MSVVELPRLLPRLEYIRSKRYGRIKQYLVSGIKSGRLESDDPGQFVKNIRDFLADIQYFIYHHYGLVNHVRSIWQMMVMIFKGNAITLEEKKLLAEAARDLGQITFLETTGFSTKSHTERLNLLWFRQLNVGGKNISLLEDNPPYLVALRRLQQRDLMYQTKTETKPSERGDKEQTTFIDYALTSNGWWAGLEYAKKKKYILNMLEIFTI